jgi:hypothetical protein
MAPLYTALEERGAVATSQEKKTQNYIQSMFRNYIHAIVSCTRGLDIGRYGMLDDQIVHVSG